MIKKQNGRGLDWTNVAHDRESSGLLWPRQYSFGFCKIQVYFWLAEELLASPPHGGSSSLGHRSPHTTHPPLTPQIPAPISLRCNSNLPSSAPWHDVFVPRACRCNGQRQAARPAVWPLPATQHATLLHTQSLFGNVPRYIMTIFSS